MDKMNEIEKFIIETSHSELGVIHPILESLKDCSLKPNSPETQVLIEHLLRWIIETLWTLTPKEMDEIVSEFYSDGPRLENMSKLIKELEES